MKKKKRKKMSQNKVSYGINWVFWYLITPIWKP